MLSRSRQSPLLPRLARWMVVTVLCISLGLQWAVLQGVAWTGMLISFSRDGSLIEAMSKTFDGEHPCPLCLAVEDGQKQDQKKSADAPKKKLEAAMQILAVSIIAPAPVIVEFSELKQQGERRTLLPPWVPPKAA